MGPSDTNWSIVAQNLPNHANNPIHTDAGARAARFERALVAGVTTYAYCCHPAIDRFGLRWVANGESEVRFRAPVFDGDTVAFSLTECSEDNSGIDIAAIVDRAQRPLVTMSAWPQHRAPFATRPGERLETVALNLSGEFGPDYAAWPATCKPHFSRPASYIPPSGPRWPTTCSAVNSRADLGSTRSLVRHFIAVPAGSDAEISTTVIERYVRGGQRAIAEVLIRVAGSCVASVEHEAIIDLSAR